MNTPTAEPLRCPSCANRLVEVERTGVLIDACPSCRGVWLDRGELDKILVAERRYAAADPDEDFLREVEGRKPTPQRPEQGHRDDRKHKRKSFLEDLFDFG